MDDEFQISYEGVTLGVPVLTRDGEQFGILEHVLVVEEEDIFEGIVVWVGGEPQSPVRHPLPRDVPAQQAAFRRGGQGGDDHRRRYQVRPGPC